MHPREGRDDVLAVQDRVWSGARVEWDTLPEAFHLVPQHLYLP